MKYFRDTQGDVFGYDETDETQLPLIQDAIAKGWTDITGSWPPGPSTADLQAECKAQAKLLLLATDYATLPDVRAAISNGAAFDTYRATVRALFLTPVAAPTWPTKPEPVWI